MKKKARKTHRPKLRKATDRHDIVELMLRDHKPLKRLIKTLKNPDRDFAKLRAAFEEFAPLLDAHAKPEQESLYQHMQRSGEEELRVEGFEGLTEHTIVDELAKKIKSLGDEDEWKAHVKVLAELVEHHIEEEEEEQIPDLRKDFELDERVKIGLEYLRLRSAFGIEEAA